MDIDIESIEIANKYSTKFKIDNIDFITSDINNLDANLNIDTIFQNPPFGSQRFATKGIDLDFINKAVEFNFNVIYAFHMASTEEFLVNYFSKLNLEITHIFRYNFKIPKIYEFHSEEFKIIDVIVIRAIKSN